MEAFQQITAASVHASLSALSRLDTAPPAGLSLTPTPFPKKNKNNNNNNHNATPTLSLALIFAMLGPLFFLTNHITPDSPTHPVNTRTWPKHSPCFPLPKQQPADTEQGRRTSLEKFTRSVVSHLELGLFISQTTLAGSLSVAFCNYNHITLYYGSLCLL